jgi:hypothetical protein
MYERLDKLRAEVERRKKKIEDDKLKLKQAEENLEKAENEQILSDVGALNLSPEKLGELLRLIATGKAGSQIPANTFIGKTDRSNLTEDEDIDDETEDNEDEEN